MRLLVAMAAALAVFTISGSQAAAQEKLVLKELIELAKERNPALSAMRQQALSMEAMSRAEGRLDDPTLKVEFMDQSLERPLEVGPGHSMLTRYTLSQMFPFPGKLSLKERAAAKGAHSARAGAASTELDLAALVKKAYFEYAFMDETIRITTEIKELLTAASRIAATMYSTGQTTQQDVVKLNVELSNLTGELIELEAGREVSMAAIKSLVNMKQTEELRGTPELPRKTVSFDERAMYEAASVTPAIEALRADAEAGELEAALAGKNYYPDFMVGVAPVQRDGRFESYDLMFQVNIPLWRGRYENLSESAGAKARAARSLLSAGQNQKALEVRGAAIEVMAAGRQLELFETSLVPLSELSYESALKNYRSGSSSLLTLLEAWRDLKKTRTDSLRAIFEYNLKVAELERASGVDLLTGAVDEK